jgi:hypothetical protein
MKGSGDNLAPVARVLVLTEDRSRTGNQTIQTILRIILTYIAPTADVSGVELSPIPNSMAASVLPGNIWKSAKKTADQGRVDLVNRIATQLALGHFVVHHIDGDRTWSERDMSENVRLYRDRIERSVRRTLRDSKKLRGPELDEYMSRFLRLVPFWCIEAWLFQNTEEATRRCPGGDHQCPTRLSEWKGDRGKLDEERTPKELLCFGSKHNLQLATEDFPTDAVMSAQKSFAAALALVGSCAPLMQRLQPTVPST